MVLAYGDLQNRVVAMIDYAHSVVSAAVTYVSAHDASALTNAHTNSSGYSVYANVMPPMLKSHKAFVRYDGFSKNGISNSQNDMLLVGIAKTMPGGSFCASIDYENLDNAGVKSSQYGVHTQIKFRDDVSEVGSPPIDDRRLFPPIRGLTTPYYFSRAG